MQSQKHESYSIDSRANMMLPYLMLLSPTLQNHYHCLPTDFNVENKIQSGPLIIRDLEKRIDHIRQTSTHKMTGSYPKTLQWFQISVRLIFLFPFL